MSSRGLHSANYWAWHVGLPPIGTTAVYPGSWPGQLALPAGMHTSQRAGNPDKTPRLDITVLWPEDIANRNPKALDSITPPHPCNGYNLALACQLGGEASDWRTPPPAWHSSDVLAPRPEFTPSAHRIANSSFQAGDSRC